MLKLIFIGSTTRSGGSLLARLFDGHKNIVSYPSELPFPHDNYFYEIFENYSGIPMSVPVYENGNLSSESMNLYPGNSARSLTPDEYFKDKSFDKYDLLDVPKKKPSFSTTWGKEKSDQIGVRKNYLEKSYYDGVRTDFDYENFIKKFDAYTKNKKGWHEFHQARHLAFFESWDKGENLTKETSHVVVHSSGGLYLTNLSTFFKIYEDARFIIPVRDIFGYVASEKIRIARIFFGSRRFNKPAIPFYFIKKFNSYDINAIIRNWTTAITRSLLLQQKYGINEKLIVYSNENLVSNIEATMKAFSNNLKIKYENILNKPTIGKRPWGGNSHYGASSGINKKTLNNYKKVLSESEINIILKKAGNLRNAILEQKETFLDLGKIQTHLFKDLDYQKKYFDDREKINLYYGLVNSGSRKMYIKKPSWLSLIALFFSIYVRIFHIPRLLKLKFFPGSGKQNYT